MEVKTLFFMKKVKLTKNNTFESGFCYKSFLYHRFLPIFRKLFVLHKSWLIYSRKMFSTTLLIDNII